MAETVGSRVTRLENLIGILAEKQYKLDDVMTALAESQIKLHESQIETDRQMRETDRQMRGLRESQSETDRQMRETDLRMRETDRRMMEMSKETDAKIERLVQAIAEFIRNGKQSRP